MPMSNTNAKQALDVLAKSFRPRPLLDDDAIGEYVTVLSRYDLDVAMLAIDALHRSTRDFPSVVRLRAALDERAATLTAEVDDFRAEAGWADRGRAGVRQARAALADGAERRRFELTEPLPFAETA